MHRTTIPLENPIEKAVRKLATQEKRSFKDLVNDLLRRGLQVYQESKKQKIDFKWNTIQSAPLTGFDPANRASYLDLISKKI